MDMSKQHFHIGEALRNLFMQKLQTAVTEASSLVGQVPETGSQDIKVIKEKATELLNQGHQLNQLRDACNEDEELLLEVVLAVPVVVASCSERRASFHEVVCSYASLK